MQKTREFTNEEIELLEEKGKKIKGRLEYRRLESVLLRARDGKTSKEIAEILNIHPRTVEKHHQRYFQEGVAAFEPKTPGPPPGVPRFMSVEEEKALFQSLEERAEQGDWLGAGQIKPLYEEKSGQALGKNVIYKILNRNKWSKKRPRPKHPKGDPEAQSLFKKTARDDSKYC
jgi:transposase